MRLTNDEWHTVVCALQVVSEVYNEDAQQFRNHTTGDYDRTGTQFANQRDAARELSEKLSDKFGF